MQRIWAPWREEYVTAAGKGGAKRRTCMLCRGFKDAGRPGSLVVHVASLSFVMMNRFPYNAGHVMVAPRRHVGTLAAATAEELSEIMLLARRLEEVMGTTYKPDGINLGMNLGKSAGAGVADHIHLHMLPRWTGDTNFMTVVGETRVIPEDPAKACARLRSLFGR
jgi:ATP adenylyltransferase